MCDFLGLGSQWVNPAGIIANIVGVSVIAIEWRTSMYDGLSRLETEQNLLAISRGILPNRDMEISDKAKRLLDKADLASIVADEDRFSPFIKNLLILDSSERLSRRRAIFTVGFALVLSGSITQLVAAWPC